MKFDVQTQRADLASAEVHDAGDGSTTVRLRGELDHEGVERVGAGLMKAAAACTGRLGVDTSAVSFVDSAGLRLLLRAHQTMADRGLRFGIDHPSSQMERLLALTGLDELIGER